MKNRKTQGFTLIELLIVIAIIGILAAVLIPNLLGARKRAYDTGAQSCASALGKAAAMFQIDTPAMTQYPSYTVLVADTAKYGTNTCTAAGANMVIADGTPMSSTQYTYKAHDTRGTNFFTVSEGGIATSGS